MPSACDAGRRITTKRRASAPLFPLPSKHQISYSKQVPIDPFRYLSVLSSIFLALHDAGPRPASARYCGGGHVVRLYWLHGVWVVCFLSLAQSAAVDVFLFIFVLI